MTTKTPQGHGLSGEEFELVTELLRKSPRGTTGELDRVWAMIHELEALALRTKTGDLAGLKRMLNDFTLWLEGEKFRHRTGRDLVDFGRIRREVREAEQPHLRLRLLDVVDAAGPP